MTMEVSLFRLKIYDKLLEWKAESDSHMALLIEGARRVGMTNVLEAFAKNESNTAAKARREYVRQKEAFRKQEEDLAQRRYDAKKELASMPKRGRHSKRRKELEAFLLEQADLVSREDAQPKRTGRPPKEQFSNEHQRILNDLAKQEKDIKGARYALGHKPENRTESQTERLKLIENSYPDLYLPRHVRGAAVDLTGVLAGERAAADPAHTAVGVACQLAAGHARVGVGAAHDEFARGVDQLLKVGVQTVLGSGQRHEALNDRTEVLRLAVCGVLHGAEKNGDLPGLIVIWRCNAKYKDKEHHCSTPHLTEDEIKAAFVRMVNKLAADRKALTADLREIQADYSGTGDLEPRLRELDERLNRDADAVQELIAQNARVAQNQEEYNARYDAVVSRYEATKAEHDGVAAELRQRGIRKREFDRFIRALEELPETVTEFDEAM